MKLISHIDAPLKGSRQNPFCMPISGWAFVAGDITGQINTIKKIQILADSEIICEINNLYFREDVQNIHGLARYTRTGFESYINAPMLLGRTHVAIACHAILSNGANLSGASTVISFFSEDYRKNHYGIFLDPNDKRVYHREHIYCSGPSLSQVDAECRDLILKYLSVKNNTVLDVGCGVGAYGEMLLKKGYKWHGVEIKESDCRELKNKNLPHTKIDAASLPFASGSFENTLCIEVLEHIEDMNAFLTEIRRVTTGRFLVSVPNCELIPYMQPYAAVPWHMLEGDHKNFFTPQGLQNKLKQFFTSVDILKYALCPLKNIENQSLYYNLFACAST
jgi:2-polyprenyl-3-methyl-5-hydroxy-6-metoxy-1,4-benzoquinol methylase